MKEAQDRSLSMQAAEQIWPILTALGLFLAHPLPASPQDVAELLDPYLTTQVESQGIPGLTVAVVKDDKMVYARAFGLVKLGGDEALTPQHVFHYASVSKPFVATAVMQLVEKGRVRLDDPVVYYLPYFRMADRRSSEITIRQMLNHSSGMPDVQDYGWETPDFDEGAAERYVRQISSLGLVFGPGESQAYSNMAFDVLGDLIAKVSGMPFERYMEENIFVPLGMQRTTFFFPDVVDSLRVSGHVDRPARVTDVYPYNRPHAPSSTLNSNVIDMSRWLRANLNRGRLDGIQILDAKSYDILWMPSHGVGRKFEVGLSWFLAQMDGARIVYHQGGDTGFSSIVVLAPEEALALTIASNWEKTDTWSLAVGIIERMLEGPAMD